MGDDDTERRVDALFVAPPDAFVGARDALSKSLRAGGDKASALAVKALRRPTAAAWAVNQLTRAHADEVGELVAVGERLREAHRLLGSGQGNASLREAMAERRRLVSSLTQRAVALLGAGGPAQRDAVTATLEAAVSDPADGAAVLAGRLSRELAAPSGFGGLLVTDEDPGPPGRRDPSDACMAEASSPPPPVGPTPDTGAAERQATARAERQAAAEAERARHAAVVAELTREVEDTAARADADAAAAWRAAEEVRRLRSGLDAAVAAEAAAADRAATSAAEAVAARQALDAATGPESA